MELLDNDDLGNMISIYCSTRNVNPQAVKLFAQLVDLEPIQNVTPISQHHSEDFNDSDLDKVPNNIDNEGTEEGEDVHPLSIENPSRDIVIWSNLGDHMMSIDPDTILALEFPEYPDIIHAYRLATYSELEGLFVGQ
ncbi:hypothetical protein GOBAR_DD19810 [Gossypium barbadense]|nr:hypothetical protein GOBAR_DD19810 [Gossypium barbadense]